MKRFKMFIIFVFVVLALLNVFIYQLKPQIDENIPQNFDVVDNMHTLGLITCNEDLIFYMDYSDGTKLVKWNLNTNVKSVISIDNCCYINIVKDYIYYVNINDNFSLYRMNFDGEQKEKIYDVSIRLLSQYRDNLYFVDSKNSYLYCMQADNLKSERIAENVKIYTIDNNTIYYVSYEESEHIDNIMKLSIDEYAPEFVDKASEIQWIDVCNENIYYYSFSNGVYELSLSDSAFTKLINGNINPQTLYIYKNHLYYRDFNIRAVSRKFDLKKRKKVPFKNIKFSNINVFKDRIFFYENDKLYLMDLNGLKKKTIILCN